MSVVLSAVYRRGFDQDSARRRMLDVLRAITPESIQASSTWDVRHNRRHVQGTLNLPGNYPRRELSLCQGKLYDADAAWWTPGSGVPDGSYTMVREDEASFEALSDPGGSRMLWYYHDDQLFAVSNSERLLTMYTGRFELDREILPWVVSTGTRGLYTSYNRHLRQLPPAAVARLDRASWRLSVTAEEIRFAEVPRSREEHLAELDAALAATFSAFGPEDARHAVISLSGGVDSRALAVYLARDKPADWPSVTIGTAAAFAAPETDVATARRAAEGLGLRNEAILTDVVGSERLGEQLREFVIRGEGRHDHLGRLDGGFAHKAVHDRTLAIIRGDESFGLKEPSTRPLAVRASMELLLCSEIENLRPHLAAFGLDGQRLPAALERRDGESIPSWRDRLHQMFRVPLVLAALSEHKSTYFDAINPLLSRRALQVARTLPDEVRTGKALFRELVTRLGPAVPFTGRVGAPNRLDSMRHPEVVRTMRAALDSEAGTRVFGPLAPWLSREISPVRHFCNRVVRAVTTRGRRYLGIRKEPNAIHLDPLRLAFRLYIAITMIEQLEADAHFAPFEVPHHQAA